MPEPPEHLPFIDAIMIDIPGNVWVRRYVIPTDQTQEWWVYSRDGSLIAALETSSRLRITEVGEDYVLGVFRDEDDIQRVHRYQLVKMQ
jgi:hypothetical protein